MRVNEKMRKALSILLCLCMLLQNAPVMAFAVTTDNLCEHHTEHTAECGYREGSAGSACAHEHSEDCYAILDCKHTCGDECDDPCTHECTVENGCITMELDCRHVHGGCGYSEGTAEVPCGHVHNESCGYVEAVAGTPCANAETDPECDHLGSCGYVAAVEGQPCGHTACDDTCGYAPATEGTPCTHVCEVKVDSDDSCYKLLCSHKDGGHDDACGYVAAVEAHDCHYECAECAAALTAEDDADPTTEATTEPSTEATEPATEATEPAPVCDCGTDDGLIHATTCAVYVAPENPVCYCTEKCTEVNVWCDVCGFDYTACTGTDTAALYEDTTYPYAVVDTEAGTVTIDGTLGGKTDATEEDLTALVAALKSYVESGYTTIIVTGSQPAKLLKDGYLIPVVSLAFEQLTYDYQDEKIDSYWGTVDLIYQDVTEIVEYEFYVCDVLKSITLPKVTTVGDRGFWACYYLETLTFGSVVTAINDNSGEVFYDLGYEIDGCNLALNCGQLQAATEYQPNLNTNTWWKDNEWKSITLTHTEGTAATCIAQAVCSVCGESYGELGAHTAEPTYVPNAGDSTQHDATYSCCGATVTEAHTMNVTTGKCVCGTEMTVVATVTDGTNTYYAADAATLNQAVTAILETGSRTFTVELPADAEAGMITTIRRAICDTEGVADGSIHLTLKGVTTIPGTTNWDGVAFGPRNAQWDENNVEIVSHEEVTQLASVNLPDVTEIGAQAFYFCENLVSVSAPKAQTIGAQALGYTALTSVEFPELTTIPTDMFSGTWTLSSAKFPKVTTIEQGGLLVGAKFMPENNPTPFPLELTAEGDITFNGSNHFNIKSQNYSGKVDLVLCCDKADKVTKNEDGTATWQVRDDLSYTFKSITFKHSYVDGKCTACGEDCTHTGGEATCTEKAICEACGTSYGEVDTTNHDSSVECVNGFCPNGCYEPATLNAAGYYEIDNAGKLFWFAQEVNVKGNREIKGVLTADIDLENKPWTPIGETGENNNNFRGVFDGQGHTIKGLYVEGGRAGLGFFGEVRTGTVKNFTIYGNVVVNTEVDYVGGVIGSIYGLNSTDHGLERNGAIIQNITSFVNVTAKAHGIGMIGGFVGYANHQSLIEQCAWYGTFDAGEYRVDSGAGGFIGKIQENTSEVTIRNCGAYGTIKTNYAGDYNNTATIYMGGFLSFSNTNAQTTLENCLFAGRFERGENLTDQAFLGAFGTLRSVNAIKNCYYLGDDGLEAVHSDSNLKPGSDNVEITSVTGEELRNNTIATQLGDHWMQDVHYPIPKDTKAHSDSATYTYTDNGDGTHKATCNECGYVEEVNEAHSGGTATTYTDNGNGTHSFKCAKCDAVMDSEPHTIENHVCTACGAKEIVVSFNAGDYKWETGDQINFAREVEGICIDYCVFTATVAEDGTVTWSADKPFCWYGEGEQKLFAAPNNGWSIDYFVVPEDQSTVAKLDKADLINGMWVGTPTTDTITFNMTHRMAKVTVNYEFAEGVTADISELKVYSIAQICRFSLDDWSIITSAGQYDVWVTPYLDGNQFTAFVSPDAYAADGNFIKITLDDGTVYEVKKNKAVTFEEGAEYTYTVVITADGAYLTCADECTFEYTDNEDGLTHSKTCSKCGYVAASENHTLTYTTNGSTITESCSANCGHTGTATISATGKTYDGNAVEVVVSKTGSLENTDIPVTLTKDSEAFTGEPVNAGAYTASITLGGKTVSVNFTIAKAEVSIATAPTPNTLTYIGEAQYLISAGEAVGGTMVYSLTENGEYTTSIPQGTNAGDYTVWYYVQGDANYNDSAKDSVAVTIEKATVTVTADAKSKPYGTDNPTLTYTSEGLFGDDVLTGALETKATKTSSVGEYDITVGSLTNSNYTIHFVGAKLTITKAASSCTAPVAVSSLTFNGGNQNLITAGTATGGTMQYSLDGSNWSETIPTGKDADTYTVYYKVVGDGNHNDADGGSLSVTIAPKVITNPVIEGIDAQYLHTGSAITPVPTAVKDGNTVIDPSEYTLTYENNINEGTATLKIVDAANGNYTVSGSKTFQIVVHAHVWNYSASGNTITATCNGNFGTCPDAEQSFTLNAPDVGYSGNPVEAEVTRDGTDLTFTLHYTGINYDSADAPTNAGDYTVTMTVGDKSVSDTFTISPKDISKVASCQFSLTQISFVYSGKAPVLNVTGVDSSIGSYTMQEGTDYTVGTVQVNAGSNKLTVTGIGNYTGTVKLDYTITAKEVSIIGAAIQSVTYDPNGYTLTVTGVTFDGVVDGENLAYTAEAILGNTNAFGEQDATVTVTLNNSNYNLATATYQTKVTINKAAATVIAAPTPNDLTYTGVAQNLINGGEANGGTMQYSTDNQTWSTTIPQGTDAGEYIVYYKVVGDANHSDTAVESVEVTIDKAQAVITVDTTPITVTYGETVSLPTATTNFGTVVCDKTADDLVNAGTYTVTYTVAGTENFEGATKTLTVKVEQLAVAEPTVTGTYTYSGREQTAQLIGVESYMTVASGNKGTNAGNYEVEVTLDGNHKWAEGSDGKIPWSIDKAKAEISVNTDPITVTYGETVTLPTATTNFGDVVCSKKASDIVNAGTYTVTYTVAGTDNYTGDTKSITVTVNAKAITVTADALSKTYGDADPKLTYKVEGLVNGDELTGELKRVAGENVGSYAIEQNTLTAGNNYSITYTGANLTINAKTITEADVELNGSLTYTGKEQTQPITVTEGITYTVTGDKATNVGSYVLTVQGTGNYTGEVKLSWSIMETAAVVGKTPTAKELTYIGAAQALVNAGTTADGKLVYSLSENGEFTDSIPTGQDAGEYTVWYYVQGDDNHSDSAKASVKVTIAKADPVIGTVGCDMALFDSTAASAVELTRTDMSVEGTLVLTDSELTAGEGTYNWKFTPKDTNNYNTITGTVVLNVTADVLEKIEASGTLEKDSYSYGDTFSIDGLTVTATYTSGATKDVTELVSFDNTLAVGQSSVELTYQGKTCTVTGFTVAKKQLVIDRMAWDIPENAVYSGTAYNATLTGNLPEGVTVTKTGDTATNAGDYTAKAVFSLAEGYSADNYEIVNGENLTADWTIAKKNIAGATITLGTALTYNGKQQTQTVAKVEIDGLTVTYTVSGNTGTDAKGYTLTVTGNGNFEGTETKEWSIKKAAAVVTKSPAAKSLTYTGEAQALVNAGTTADGKLVYSLTENGEFTESIPTGKNAGEYTVWYYVVGDDNHSDSAKTSVKVTIAKAKATIKVDTTTINITYGETVNLPAATTNFGTVVCDKTAADLKNVGSYTVTYTVAGTENFEGATKTLTVKVEQLAVAEPTVTGTYTYSGREQTAQLIGVESYMTVASGNKGTNAGNYEVEVTLDGNHKWAEGSDGKIPWSIDKAKAEISVNTDPITVTYGETVTLPTATTNFGDVVCNKKASDIVNAGTYTVTYTVAGTDNYDGDTKSITVIVNAKAITVTADALSKTYGDADPKLTYKVEGLVNGDELTGELKRVAGENVGSYTIEQNTLTAGDNYTITYTGANLTINAKAITEADVELNGSLTYTGKELTQPITVTEGITYTVIGDKATNVGTYVLTVQGTDNYTGEVKLSWSIKEAAAVVGKTPTAKELTYIGAAQALVNAGTTADGKLVYSLSENGEFTDSIPTGQDAGEYTVWYYVQGDDNHSDSAKASVKVTIAKAKLTVTAKDNTITYGDAPAANGVQYSGLVTGENEAVLNGNLSYGYGYAQFGDVGSYAITPSGLTSNNYEIQFVDGKLTVTQRVAELQWNNHEGRIYGDGKEVTVKITNPVNGDAVDATVAGGKETSVGTHTASITGLTGEKAGNYTLNGVTFEKAYTIEKAKLQSLTNAPADLKLDAYSADAQTVIGKLPTSVTYTTETGNITVDIQWSCQDYDSTVKKENAFQWTVKDGQLENYTANGIATSGTVTVTNADALPVINSGTTAEITYDGSTYDVSQMFTIDENAGAASYAIVEGTGAGSLNGSVLTITRAGTMEIRLTTEAAGIYAAGEATAVLTVKKAAGSGTVEISGWTYGQASKVPTANGTGTVTYLYTGENYSSAAAPTNAGVYTVTATFAATDLYEQATAKDTFTIEQAKLTVTVTAADKAYDGTTAAALEAVLNGVIQSDSIAVEGITGSFSDANAGQNKTVAIDTSNAKLTGEKASNYVIDQMNSTTTATITKASVAAPAAGVGYTLDYAKETITVAEGFEVMDAEEKVVASGSAANYFGQTLKVRVKETDNAEASQWTSFSVSARPAQPNVTVQNETLKGKEDGAVNGMDSTMEYSTDNGSHWIPVENTSAITGLKANTILQVRVKATTAAPHGEAKICTVAAGTPITVTYDSNGQTADGMPAQITNLSYSTKLTQPADPAAKNTDFAFRGWYKDAACTNAWDFEKDTVTEESVTIYAKWEQVYFSVEADIYRHDGQTLYTDKVHVRLMRGDSEIAQMEGTGGKFKFEKHVQTGMYNLVAVYTDEAGEHTKTELITVDHDDEYKLILPEAGVNSHLTVSGNAQTPDVMVGNLDAEAEKVKQEADTAAKVEVEMTVTGKTEAQVSDAVVTAVEAATNNATVEYLDITVTKQINDGEKTEMSETSNVMEILVPYNADGKTDLRVFRHHGGQLQEFVNNTSGSDRTFCYANGYIHIFTRYFSNYMITYEVSHTVQFHANGGAVTPESGTTKADGTLASLPTPTRDGYVFKGWYTAASGGTEVTTSYVFRGDVTIYARWGGYSIAVADTSKGTVSVDRSEASGGTKVSITVTPKYGYKMETLTVKDSSGKSYSVSTDNKGKYFFTMPNADVTVKATFSQISTYTPDHTNPKTGDDFEGIFWSGMMMTTLLGAAVLMLNKKKYFRQ